MRKFLDVHDAHCCKIHGCKYNDEKCTVVNGLCEGLECEQCEEEKMFAEHHEQFIDDWFKKNTNFTRSNVMTFEKLLETVPKEVKSAIERICDLAGTSDANWEILKTAGILLVNKYKYKLSYTQCYSIDHLTTDSDDYHQNFHTLQEALDEYEKLKAKNTSKNWPRRNFSLIEYKDLKLND